MDFKVSCLNNNRVFWSGGFWGEHGISLLIERGGSKILFDTGESGEILAHNLDKLNNSLQGVTHIVLSHAHYDHTGGLLWALEAAERPTVIGDPLIFQPKFNVDKDTGERHATGIPFRREQIAEKAQLHLTTEMTQVADGVHISGRIPRSSPFENLPDSMLIETANGLQQDEMLDDRSMILETKRGLVVVCGCCHAGLVNTLTYTQAHFDAPIFAIIGGIHLVQSKEEQIDKTIAALQQTFKPQELYLNHCTGDEATVALVNAFGKQAKPFLVGEQLTF